MEGVPLLDALWLPDVPGVPGVDGLPVAESRPEGDGIDGMDAVLGLDDGMDGMLRDEEDDDEGDDGMLLDEDDEEEDDDDGGDGMELCDDCWLADSQPARTRAVALITNICLTNSLFMLNVLWLAYKLPDTDLPDTPAILQADNQYLSKTGVRKDLLADDFMNFFLQRCAWSHFPG